MGILIRQIITSILNLFSRKEGDAELKKQKSEYVSRENFSVHAPKWIIPLLVVYELVFAGFAVFSYLYDVKIAVVFFVAFCIVGFVGIMFDIAFCIKVEGQQVSVTRLFRGTKFFVRGDIISVRKDNAGAVILVLGKEKIHIDPTMVNKDYFYSFAQGCAWSNADSGIKQTYKVYRNKGEYIFLMLVLAFFLSFAAFYLLNLTNCNFTMKILGLSALSLIAIVAFVYLICLLNHTIIVEEQKGRFSYKKGFVRKMADIGQVNSFERKTRFLESAGNYFVTVSLSNGKSDLVKFASLDENSDRFCNYLLKEIYTSGKDASECEE
ncbi:MAG: hypothetical protein J5817_04270 [Treponema sp.]|nr:hypothetical protein [Treponema sp.]